MLKILFVLVSVYMHVIIYSYGYSCISDKERKHTIVCDTIIPSMKANHSYLPQGRLSDFCPSYSRNSGVVPQSQ